MARRYEKEYTPLRPEDIEREPPPRRPVADTYLTSRLQRFYAELAQYQPGVNRAEYESKLHALGGGLLPSPADGCAHSRAGLCVYKSTRMLCRAEQVCVCVQAAERGDACVEPDEHAERRNVPRARL